MSLRRRGKLGLVRGATLGEYALLLFAVLIVGALGFKALGNPVKQNADDARAWLEGDGPNRGGAGGGAANGGGAAGAGGAGGATAGSPVAQGGGAAGGAAGSTAGSDVAGSNGSNGRLSDAPGSTSGFGTTTGAGGANGGFGSTGTSGSGNTAGGTASSTGAFGTSESNGAANGTANKTIGATDDGEEDNRTIAQRVRDTIVDLSPIGDVRDAIDIAKDIYANGVSAENLGQAVMVGVSMTGPGKVIKIASRVGKTVKKAEKAEKAAEKVKIPETFGGNAGKAPVKKAVETTEEAADTATKTEKIADKVDTVVERGQQINSGYEQVKDGLQNLKNTAAKKVGAQAGGQAGSEIQEAVGTEKKDDKK